MENLKHKTFIITGGGRGIGAEASKLIASKGANVILTCRTKSQGLSVEKEILNKGDSAKFIPQDVTIENDWRQVVDEGLSIYGRIDGVVNNAGRIKPIQRLADIKIKDWNKIIDVNLKGVFYGFKLAIPSMLKSGGGTFLTLSSGAAHNPLEAWSHYCASKAAANMLTQCLHHEEGGNGIRAIGLSPGTVATDMQRDIKDSGVNPVSQLDWDVHIPADWPARALLWMCGPEADRFLGDEISLRDEGIRKAVGLI